ncbi:Uncharacterized protein Adt_42394 [Abeliophyllum distichum]|uniref:Uncharacterized protein n=1 Tax=Abeliophyllum distichum TaxID=126358 RepID=A0ABD1PRJ4_9LAMI
MQSIRNNAKYFTHLVGNQVKFTVPPCYPLWTEVTEEQPAWLRSIIDSYFDLQDDRSSDEYQIVCAAVDCLAVDRYRDYKLKAHNHLKAHGPNRPYDKLSTKDWQKCIDFFNGPAFVERSVKNKANRDKAKYFSVQGSKNFFAMRSDEWDPEIQKWPGVIESF